MYRNTSPDYMDYLSLSPSIVYFTSQRSLIKRNLIAPNSFSQGKVSDAFCATQFYNHNAFPEFQKSWFYSAEAWDLLDKL